MPPCATKRRTTTNLKTQNNQNCQKIELYGGLTTKELKKKHSSRLVGGVDGQPRRRGHAARWQLEDWEGEVRLAVPPVHADKPGGTTGG